MKKVCYIPLKGVDDVIASKLGDSFNPFRVATLRGMYDETHDTPLDTSNPDKAAIELAKYRNLLKKVNNASMNSVGTNLAPSYEKLRRSFTAEERFNRVNMIAAMFSAVIDEAQKHNPQLSRRAAVEGFTDGGQKRMGEFFIFEKVYDQILHLQSFYRAKGEVEKADKFNQVIENWSALTAFARMKLRDTEGVKLGNELEFADETTELNYGDNDMTQLFSAEESTREHWTTTSGMESAFGSVGKQVRRLISSLPIMEVVSVTKPDGRVVQEARPKRDDLGFVQTLDPTKVHQALMEAFRGITSEAQMMGALRNPRTGQAKQTWMIPILDALMKNPELRTQFFRDFKKNFQPYGILVEDRENSKGGLKRWKTKLLNRVEDLLGGSFMSRILLGKSLNPANSVFDSKGNVNAANLQKVVSSVREWLNAPQSSTGTVFDKQKQYGGVSKFYTRGGSSIERREFLRDSLEALGVEIDMDTLDQIMNNSRDLRKLTNALQELVQFGISEDQLKRLANGETISYKSMVRQKKQNSKKEGPFQEKIRKIHEIITKNREGLRLESRVRHKDSKGNNITLFSQVNPSFMGDRFDRIQAYVKANDKAGLRTYITNEYLGSTFFKRDGVILNKWLEELLECCNSKEDLADTFAAQFDYMRFLGTSDMSFENFTSKQHMIDMLTEFRADRELSSKAETALYPVFILGDSGVSKYIRAKRYDGKTILDGLYNTYRQEIERQKLVRATNEWLEEEGKRRTGQAYKGVDNFSKTASVFTTLQFLNSDHKSADGTVGKYADMLSENPTETEVKAAIRAYLDDAVAEFKTRLNGLGLLETKEVIENGKDGKPVKVERYVYLGRDVSPSNLDTTLADFYWNTKFATIQQLQLMTIDPGFYKGTKDLQKRYKEIHAPGSLLSLSAVDKYGKKYSEDGIERCVYFDDIEIDAEETNPEFMDAIAAVHGRDSKVYKMYKGNTLTDGQGYRTLRSYRKVMGMAGQWTEEMQKAFEAIEQLRAEYSYGKDGNHTEIPAEQIAEIARLAVVFQPIKPYMFTHEKLAVNGTNQAIIPVQHKYAEAVLIPELLPAGSKLRDMAYWMDEENIDLVGSTKIVKVGGFGSTDISKASDAKSLREALAKGYVHQLNYGDYRIQTNVPEHINSSQLFGTQVRKLIMAGINMDDYHYQNYIDSPDGMVNLGGIHGKVRLNGRNLVSFYNSLIVSNILESFDKFNAGIANSEGLSSKLIQSVINNSRESMDNILAYALNEDGNFSMPLFEGGLEHDAAAMMLSMFKKLVNKQSIKGGSAVQVSAMGIKGYEKDGDLKYVTDGKGNILYAECEIPFDISYTDENGREVELDFNEYCNSDGTLKMGPDGKASLLETRFPGSTSLLAYRIPTERDYSMLNLRVKRFSQKTAGGTIKAPAQGTTIAGFDFDVDKLYFMRREYKARKRQTSDKATDNLLSAIFGQDTSALIEFEEYDFEKSPLQNSRAARNNMLINLIQQRLMDPETMEQRTTPGGFANASRSARVMRELLYGSTDGIVVDGRVDFNALNSRADDKSIADPEPNYDPSDPMTIVTYNQQNQVAGKLIGIFANQNTNHAFASLMKTFRILKPIEFAGHSYGDGKVSDFLNAPEGINVDLNVAEFLSASVDAVKDPVLNFMNLNTITADSGAVLARIGYTTTEIGVLFNQPIIKEVCEYCFNNNVGVDTAIRDIKDKYKSAGASVKSRKDPLNPASFTMDKLAKNILNDRVMRERGSSAMDNTGFATDQLEVLDLFSDISSVANDVSQFVTSTKFTASNAVGSTFGDLYAQQMKVQKYLSTLGTDASHVEMEVTDKIGSPINNESSLTSMSNEQYLDTMIDNPFAYEQAMFDANRKALIAMTKYFPYDKEAYASARGRLANLTRQLTLDADTINSIHSDMMVYLLASQERSEFNGDLPKNDTGHGEMTTREYYTKWFAKDLLGYLEDNPHMKGMAIFEYMLPTVNEETDEVSVNIQGIGGLAPYMKDEIRESWAELSRNPETSRIATDLFMYNFYKLGFNFSPMAFMNLAPTEVKQNLQVPNSDGSARSYVEFMEDIMADKLSINPDSFARQYMLNHLDNKRFGMESRSKVANDILRPLALTAGLANPSFTLDLSRVGKDNSKMFTIRENKMEKTRAFTPIIRLRTEQGEVVYMADYFDDTQSTTMTYRKVERLGTKGQSLQYYGESSMPSTIADTVAGEVFEDGSTGVESEPEVPVEGFDRDAAINEIADKPSKAYEKAGIRDDQGELISAAAMKAFLIGQEDAILQQTVEELRQACVVGGVIVLDENGNPVKAC